MERWGEGEKENKNKRMQMCFEHVVIPHNECNCYVLQICTNKNKIHYNKQCNFFFSQYKVTVLITFHLTSNDLCPFSAFPLRHQFSSPEMISFATIPILISFSIAARFPGPRIQMTVK